MERRLEMLSEDPLITLYLGDCTRVIKEIPDSSVQLILQDPPYNLTEIYWEEDIISQIKFLWREWYRVLKANGAIVMTAVQPFTSKLVMSNLSTFKYSLVWQKTKISHFAQAPYRFLTEHEDILVFSMAGTAKNAKVRMKYNPQGVVACERICRGKGHSDHRPKRKQQADYIQTMTNYPKSILRFKSTLGKLHPTQKPIALMEYLIRTFTDEDDTVLDCFAGSGTTGVAAANTNRNCILIEKEEKYVEIIKDRFSNIQLSLI